METFTLQMPVSLEFFCVSAGNIMPEVNMVACNIDYSDPPWTRIGVVCSRGGDKIALGATKLA